MATSNTMKIEVIGPESKAEVTARRCIPVALIETRPAPTIHRLAPGRNGVPGTLLVCSSRCAN